MTESVSWHDSLDDREGLRKGDEVYVVSRSRWSPVGVESGFIRCLVVRTTKTLIVVKMPVTALGEFQEVRFRKSDGRDVGKRSRLGWRQIVVITPERESAIEDARVHSRLRWLAEDLLENCRRSTISIDDAKRVIAILEDVIGGGRNDGEDPEASP